jgi:predicted dehydrogenase
MSNYLNYGILGFGRYAYRRLEPAFTKTMHSRLFGISRTTPQNARTTARELDIPFYTADPLALVSHRDIQAIIVTSPPALHREHVLLASENGKHVLVEKPIASSAREVQEMIDCCNRNRVKLMSGFVMRFIDAIQQTRNMIQSGKLGRIHFAGSSFGLKPDENNRSWLNDPHLSAGGPVADLGSHLIDLLQFILNKKVVRLHAVLKPDYSKSAIERNALVQFEWEDDILSTMYVSFDVVRESTLTFYGSKGKLTLRNFNQSESMVEIEWLSAKGRNSIRIFNHNYYARMLDHLAEAILFNKEILLTGQIGLENQQIIDEIYGRVSKK